MYAILHMRGMCSFAAAAISAASVCIPLRTPQENIGWALGFAIPAAAMLCAIVTFVAGSPLYTHVAPTERCAQMVLYTCVVNNGWLRC